MSNEMGCQICNGRFIGRGLCENCGPLWTPVYIPQAYDSKMHLIAGWLYEFNRDKKNEYLSLSRPEDFEKLLYDSRMPKTHMQRLEKLLINLYKSSDVVGENFYAGYFGDDEIPGVVTGETEKLLPISIAYAKDLDEVYGMLHALEQLGFMVRMPEDSLQYIITPKGFEKAEQLLSSNIESKSVFVAMAFRDDLLEAYKKAIKPACEACGFNAIIISDKPHNNGITDEIIVEIKRSQFVIVDFTYNNNGAYWEAGYAQGLGRVVIRCCKAEWYYGKSKIYDPAKEKVVEVNNGLHFDVKHYNTILWESHEQLIEILKSNIRANIPDAKLEDKPEEQS